MAMPLDDAGARQSSVLTTRNKAGGTMSNSSIHVLGQCCWPECRCAERRLMQRPREQRAIMSYNHAGSKRFCPETVRTVRSLLFWMCTPSQVHAPHVALVPQADVRQNNEKRQRRR